MEILWLRKALRDLEAMQAHIGADDPAAAARIFEKILTSVDRLATAPHLGRPGRVTNTRELIIAATPFIVPYRIAERRVIVLAVLHSSRRWPETF